MLYNISVSWVCSGVQEVEAESLDKAKSLAASAPYPEEYETGPPLVNEEEVSTYNNILDLLKQELKEFIPSDFNSDWSLEQIAQYPITVLLIKEGKDVGVVTFSPSDSDFRDHAARIWRRLKHGIGKHSSN